MYGIVTIRFVWLDIFRNRVPYNVEYCPPNLKLYIADGVNNYMSTSGGRPSLQAPHDSGMLDVEAIVV